jgi:hypothetical protein
MPADCCHPRRARAPWVALASALLAALVPKCPLCLAGYLSVFGAGVGAAGVAVRVLRPFGLAVCALALAVMVGRALVSRPAGSRSRRPSREPGRAAPLA